MMRWALAPVPCEFEALCFQCVRNRIGEFKEHFVALHGVDDRRLRTGRQAIAQNHQGPQGLRVLQALARLPHEG